MNDIVVGCKLLREDGGSLREKDRVIYPVGEWIEVPGNGAYVAITGGLISGGVGPVLAYFECADLTDVRVYSGVRCFRRVRRLPEPVPERITPALRGSVACYAPELSSEQRVELALKSTPEWRGGVACWARGLSAEHIMELVHESTPWWRGHAACYAPGLSAEQRIELVLGSTPEWRGEVACCAPDLSAEQRMKLALKSTQGWRSRVARYTKGLSAEQRTKLRRSAT